tara:strand:+ start:583 stop:969 length:387 start_codon:yes stop_codon:yes gene_type:complete
MGFLESKLKNQEFIGKLIGGIILVIVLIGITFQYYQQKEIRKYKEQTTGKIIKFKYENKVHYGLVYEYYVKGKHYSNQIGVSFFKCDDGTKGCIGKEFTIYYSSKTPEYSRIDLGKYEKYKTTVEFVK